MSPGHPKRLPARDGLAFVEASEGEIKSLGQINFLQPRGTGLPAQSAQHMAAANKRICDRVLQINAAITIPVRAAVQNIFGQHLDHTNLAGPSALRLSRIKITAFVKLKRCKNLRTKQLRAPAIMRQGQQRIERVKIALIDPKIRFKCPKGQ